MADNKNVGVAPPDFESDVGKFRAQIGDTSFEPLDPPEEGKGQYTLMSDAEIQVYLDVANGSLYRALGDYNLALANAAAENSKIIKDHDLQVSTVQRANDYRRIALAWYGRADKDDEVGGLGDIFDTFTLGGNSRHLAEGSLPEWGRTYTWDRL